MKRVTVAILMYAALTMDAFANGYCDGRPTMNDRINCYRAAIELNNNKLREAYRVYVNYPGFTAEQRDNIRQRQLNWENTVNSQCNNDSCIEKSLKDRTLEYKAAYNKLSK